MKIFSPKGVVQSLLATLTFLCLSAGSAHATNWYVSGSGNDSNNGTSTSTPFSTLQKAADQVNPGDTVYLMNGTYTDTYGGSYVMAIRRSGNANAWIKVTKYPGQNPVIETRNNWYGVDVQGASYIWIDGLTVKGNNAAVQAGQNGWSQQDAINRMWEDRPEYGNHGISADIRWNGSTKIRSHHIKVTNCTVYEHGGTGIGGGEVDYYTIENNTVYNNGWYSPHGESGIHMMEYADFDSYTDYKNFIRRNVCYGNRNYVNFRGYNGGTEITDGNGIIIDTSKTYNYQGRTLVANNICYNNGGSGIHSMGSEHVDIINNTAYHNGQTSNLNGEIYAQNSNDVRILNNVLISLDGKGINKLLGDTNVSYDYNVYFNNSSSGEVTMGPHDLRADPKLVNPGSNDFHLQSSSPAVDSGTSDFAPSDDYEGNNRPRGNAIDRGAYESAYSVSQGSGGSLQGSGNSSTSGANLTTEGPTDWMHLGDSSLNRKATGGSQLSYSVVSNGPGVSSYSNDLRSLSWSDGTPTGSGNNANGLYVGGLSNGFQITAPADTTQRTLIVHVGGFNSSAKLTASLSDGSAPDFVDTTTSVNGQYDRNYTLTYKAGGAGKTLTVRWVVNSDAGYGNVTLNGVALATSSVSSGGLLQGSANTNLTAVNLTSEGTGDWIHLGDSSLNRKSGGNNQIAYSLTPAGTASANYSNDLRSCNWSNGTPATSGNNTNGIYVNGAGKGFQITVPADTLQRTLYLHLGGYSSGGKLTATLSDGSAASYTDTTATASGQFVRNYTLNYKALSSGKNLTITWVVNTDAGGGNVTLNGVALTTASSVSGM